MLPSPPPIRILHLEDDSRDAELVHARLEADGLNCDVVRVDNRERFAAELSGRPFHVILCDYNLRGYDGISALKLARDKQPDAPVMLLSGSLGEEDAVKCLQHGATDYLIKQRLERLPAAVKRALQEAEHQRKSRQAEEELRDSEERFRQLAEHSSEVFWFVRLNPERILYISPAVEKIWGLPAERFYGEPRLWMASIHPDDQARVQEAWEACLKGRSPRFEAEYRVVQPDGSLHWVLSSGTPIYDSTGVITRIGGMSRDITERKLAEHHIRQLAALLDIAQDAIYVRHLNQHITYWNKGAERLYGWTAEEAMGQRAVELLYKEETAQWREIQQSILTKGEWAGELHQCDKQGREVIVMARRNLLRDDLGRPIAVLTINTDITDRRRAEQRIREHSELLDKARDAICVTNLKGIISYWNKSAAQLYGWTSAEAVGRNAPQFLSPDGLPEDSHARQAVMEKGEWIGELRHVAKSGEDVVVESRMTLIRDSAGNPKSILSINSDIREKKQLATQMLRTQRLESIGTLAGGVAHDLNNALAPILMISELMRMRYPDATEMIDTIELSARRGADMVRQLLTFAKGAEGARLIVQPHHLFSEIERIIKGTFPKSIQLRTHYTPDLKTVKGDATQLHQVLLNLCVNARDAMPRGGTLTLKAENTEVDPVFASTVPEARPGSYVVWRVSDTGTGIAPDVLDRIFEPFFSTKGPDKGTGLGLSTIIGIVRSHEGFVQVSSHQGEGSTFSVYLPANDSACHDPVPAVRDSAAFRGHGEMILVVDDEPVLREVAKSVLTALNFQVITAADGMEAVIKVAEKRNELRAVITDLHMPNMDGLTFVRVLKRMMPNAEIIVASGLLGDEEADEFKSLGVRVLLDKPFTQEKLVDAVRTALQVSAPLLTGPLASAAH